LFSTYYRNYTETQVVEQGNGYITNAPKPDPWQRGRPMGGDTMNSGDNTNPNPSGSAAAMPRNLGSVEVVSANGGDVRAVPLGERPFTVSPGATPTQIAVPLQVQSKSGTPFHASVADFNPGGVVLDASMADGSPLPSWLSIDPNVGGIIGIIPSDDIPVLDILVRVQMANGETSVIPIRINVASES
jgi:hypothetical protein